MRQTQQGVEKIYKQTAETNLINASWYKCK